MSVMTRKQPVVDAAMLRTQAAHAARQMKPLAVKTMPIAQQAARQAVPLAKSATTGVRQGTDTAVAWAVPRIEAARIWAAPQLEHSAQAVTDSIAPMVSSALMSAAHKIEMPRKRRRRGALFAGIVLLAAGAAGGMAAVMMQRRRAAAGYPAAAGTAAAGPGTGEGTAGEPDSDMNGHPRIV